MVAETKIGPKKLFIGGKWQDAASGKVFPTINPATEEVITEVAEADERDVDLAVRAARKAFEEGPWSAMSGADRGKLLRKIADAVVKYGDEIAYLETIDTGKPISETRHHDASRVADLFEYYAGWCDKIQGETIPVRGNFLNYTLREPLGVVGAISPWNFPLSLAAGKVAPALAAGNTVVLKPSEQTPLTALRIAEIAQEVGLPDGVFNVVTGPGSTTGRALVLHPGVDKISFTGGTKTGQQIMRDAAATLKPVTLELGGKSPNIVFADADLEAAARHAFWAIFYSKGEVCCAGSRLFVEDSVHDRLMDKLVERTKRLVPGDPLDPKTRLGPLSSESQLKKVSRYVELGIAEGGKLVAGGQRYRTGNGKGYFFHPTIFDEVDNRMKIAQEEIFGPVLATIRFKDLNEVIGKSNDTPYGLAAAVWTHDIKKAHLAAKMLKAGTVWINTYNALDVSSPFGGYKMSGFGRELGMHALEHYTQVKSVWVNLGE
ncbi:MAG: betaine-aldehyde dehydrogenase [Deltaproteobacteria bacterium]|nr:betaine-aldehyde dehydrogenase [Deltaproteobacteria bacterium]